MIRDCPDCGEKVSVNSHRCPHCFSVLFTTRAWIFLLVASGVLTVLFGYAPHATSGSGGLLAYLGYALVGVGAFLIAFGGVAFLRRRAALH